MQNKSDKQTATCAMQHNAQLHEKTKCMAAELLTLDSSWLLLNRLHGLEVDCRALLLLCMEMTASRREQVIQLLFEQRILTGELAVRHVNCYLLCSAHSTEQWDNAFCQGQCCAALLLGHCVSRNFSNLTLQCHTTAVRLLSAQEP